MKNLLLFLIISLSVSVSCNRDDDNEVTPVMARDSLYYIMKEWYYWYDLMPAVTKENYADPYQLLEAMRYKPLDRWSFVADYEAFMAEMQGSFIGHGIRIGLDEEKNARISMIYNRSPLYASGVRRGWIIKSINGTDIAPFLVTGNMTAYNNVIGPATEGITNVFLFQKPDGTLQEISSTKASFTLNSVILYDTLHLSSGVTGHLVSESFITPTDDELKAAFSFFKANNVTDLILDLRYNSGGYLYVAQNLASYIAGNSLTGTTFAKLLYNDKNQDANSSFLFKSSSYSIGFQKLMVITTRLTASASEAVINGLNHFVDIISIGDTTNGKPTGMNGWDVGRKYIFWPVTFKIVNSNDEGDYFDGFTPAQSAVDDITHDFNDRNEACLKEAISYLETGAFAGKGPVTYKRSVQFSERPSWINNTFVIRK